MKEFDQSIEATPHAERGLDFYPIPPGAIEGVEVENK
jgi:hypothetical protein